MLQWHILNVFVHVYKYILKINRYIWNCWIQRTHAFVTWIDVAKLQGDHFALFLLVYERAERVFEHIWALSAGCTSQWSCSTPSASSSPTPSSSTSRPRSSFPSSWPACLSIGGWWSTCSCGLCWSAWRVSRAQKNCLVCFLPQGTQPLGFSGGRACIAVKLPVLGEQEAWHAVCSRVEACPEGEVNQWHTYSKGQGNGDRHLCPNMVWNATELVESHRKDVELLFHIKYDNSLKESHLPICVMNIGYFHSGCMFIGFFQIVIFVVWQSLP